MIFNTPIFFVFFLVFLVLYGITLTGHRPRIYLILVASLVFYGAWNYRFIPLLVGSAIADYYIARAIGATESRTVRRRWLALSIGINLGVLGLFKYADFVLESVAEALGALGVDVDLPTLAWVLPVGISFYTFQSLSYTIDVYRGELKPRRGLVEFAAALAFFPQLVAGPILRARQILPQMHNLPSPTWSGAKHGFLLMTVGMLKKTLADLLAAPAASVFDTSTSLGLLETWTGVLAFAGQIYGDFSGYTDMAIGIALVFGFQIPLNFRVPYLAVSPVDFWRRWHISLSSWLRDYLYISLGGNRTGRRFRNVMITMLLGGLWHGAAWTFVAWGAYHGMLITTSHALARWSRLARWNESRSRLVVFLKWGMTFYLVLLGWVLFRASSLGSAWSVLGDLHGMAGATAPASSVAPQVAALTVAAVAVMHVMDYFMLERGRALVKRSWPFWLTIVIGQALGLLVGAPSDEFIYFQF